MKNKKCSIWWCDRKHYALGYCKAHWAGFARYGSPYGKHDKQMRKIDDIILSARLVAVKVTEFVENKPPTEFGEIIYTWEVSEIPEVYRCPFCHEIDSKHKPLCIVNLSKNILENTGRCYNKNPETDQLLPPEELEE